MYNFLYMLAAEMGPSACANYSTDSTGRHVHPRFEDSLTNRSPHCLVPGANPHSCNILAMTHPRRPHRLGQRKQVQPNVYHSRADSEKAIPLPSYLPIVIFLTPITTYQLAPSRAAFLAAFRNYSQTTPEQFRLRAAELQLSEHEPRNLPHIMITLCPLTSFGGNGAEPRSQKGSRDTTRFTRHVASRPLFNQIKRPA